MRRVSKTVITVLGVFAGTLAYSHPGTERYIPIGESPGVSNVKSYIGEIRSVQRMARGFTMLVEDTDQRITVTETTKIYLDTGSGKTNLSGTWQDCRVGRVVEVYLHDDGTAYWVKIRAR